MDTVSFTEMENGTRDDFTLIERNDEITQSQLPKRLLSLLRITEYDAGAYQIDRLQHALQAATRAEKLGADDDWVFAALLHDIGDTVAPDNHAEIAASIIAPYARPEVTWVVRMHSIFQGYYYWHYIGQDKNMRERYRANPFFEHAVAFCHMFDQCSFDPEFSTYNLEHFAPLLERMCARPAYERRDPQGVEAMGVREAERRLYAKALLRPNQN